MNPSSGCAASWEVVAEKLAVFPSYLVERNVTALPCSQRCGVRSEGMRDEGWRVEGVRGCFSLSVSVLERIHCRILLRVLRCVSITASASWPNGIQCLVSEEDTKKPILSLNWLHRCLFKWICSEKYRFYWWRKTKAMDHLKSIVRVVRKMFPLKPCQWLNFDRIPNFSSIDDCDSMVPSFADSLSTVCK